MLYMVVSRNAVDIPASDITVALPFPCRVQGLPAAASRAGNAAKEKGAKDTDSRLQS
jgi:hypothetical protein